jgi:branched-chain amino acid transport system substrate-binding protein
MGVKAVILALALAFIGQTAMAGESIKIGAIFSVTGPASFLGEPEKNTAEMVVERLNAAGGLLGQKVELIVYDDETDVNKCVLAADKLLKKDKVVAVIGPTTSGNSLAIMNKFSAAEVPLVSCSAADKIVTPVNPWVFKVAPSDRHAVERILADAAARGYKKIAIITVSDGFGQAGRAVLQELVPAKGFTLVADEIYGPKDTDMTAQLTKIKGLEADAIICWGTNPGPAVIAKNRVQLGLSTPLYQSHGVASKKFIELAGESAEGLMLPAGRLIVAAQVAADHPDKQVLMDYATSYETIYKQPVSTFGGHAWDSLYLLAEAITRGKSAKPADIRANLEKITGFWGTAGQFNFSAADHNGLDQSAFEMVVIRNGDWQIVK